MNVPGLAVLEVEDVLFVRALHALLVVLLPEVPPRPPEHVEHFVLELGAGRQRRSLAVDREDRLHAFDEDVRIAFGQVTRLREIAHDADRLHERVLVVEDRLVVQADELAGRIMVRRVNLDRLHLVRVLEPCMDLPADEVRRPRDQGVLIPEADRLAVPARDVGAEPRRRTRHVELAADQDIRDEVARDAAHDLDLLRRHSDVVVANSGRMPAPHEAFRPAVLRLPVRDVRVALVIGLLREVLLILRRQQRHHRRDLHLARAVPGVAETAAVAARPLAGHGRVGVLRRPAALDRLGLQRLVMLLRRLERIRAHDRFARIVAVAKSPAHGAGTLLADRAARGPAVLDRDGRVAAPVTLVGPEVLVLVEVVGREHVARQRLDAFRRLAGRRRADELSRGGLALSPRSLAALRSLGSLPCLRCRASRRSRDPSGWGTAKASAGSGADDRQRGRVDHDGRAAPDALEVDLRALLRRQRRRNCDGDSDGREADAQSAVLRHCHSPYRTGARARYLLLLKSNRSSDVSLGLVMPCSKFSLQIFAHGRPYMSGISYSTFVPGVSGAFLPLTLKIVCTHSMNGYGTSLVSAKSLILWKLRTMRSGVASASSSYRIVS